MPAQVTPPDTATDATTDTTAEKTLPDAAPATVQIGDIAGPSTVNESLPVSPEEAQAAADGQRALSPGSSALPAPTTTPKNGDLASSITH